jgi:DNA-binding transcriptional MerR regulator
MASFTIGQLAVAAGVHVETVRYYERRGLLPAPPRTPAGYRLYGDDDLRLLQLVGRGKQLGFTLAEITEMVGHGRDGEGGADDVGERARSADAVLAAVRAKMAAIDERRRELGDIRRRLQLLADLCEEGADPDCVFLRAPG